MSLTAFPSNTKSIIETIINDIGREVEFFYVYSTYACPTCELDPVTGNSTDSFCPTCSGEYWVDVMSGVMYSGHVTWKFNYLNEWETGGLDIVGDARVKILHTDEREDLLKDVKWLVLDGKTMSIEKVTLLGTKPTVNRIVIDVKEKEEEKGLR
jgi:hypothetical protein